MSTSHPMGLLFISILYAIDVMEKDGKWLLTGSITDDISLLLIAASAGDGEEIETTAEASLDVCEEVV